MENDNKMIEVYDAYGRKMEISREQWVEKILPDVIKQHWNDPSKLYSDIVQALNDGFASEVKEAAKHLQEIDNIYERGYVISAITSMKNNEFSDAEKILEEYIDKYGKTGTVLTNLAKVKFSMDDKQAGEDILWEGLMMEPNQDNGLAWWLSIQKEKDGIDGYVKALEKTTAINGSYLPQLYLADYYLQNGKLLEAMGLFKYVIETAKDMPQTLYNISGALGKNGYINEMIELIAPSYDYEKHDIHVGMNLLQGYLQTENYVDGMALLDKIMLLQRPDLRQHFMQISNRFEQMKQQKESDTANELDGNKEIKQELIVLEKPIWNYGLGKSDFVIKEKDKLPKIGILTYSSTAKNNGSEGRIEKEDDLGRLTRGLPMFIQEIFYYYSKYNPVVLVPVVVNAGPIVSGNEWPEEIIMELSKAHNLDWTIAGDISTSGEGYMVSNKIVNAKDNVILMTPDIEISSDKQDFGKKISEMIMNIFMQITGNDLFQAVNESSFYEVPDLNHIWYYVVGLDQSMTQTMVDNSITPKNAMWGERNIINWYMQLCIEMPKNAIVRIMFITGLMKSKSYGSTVYREYKEAAAKIINDFSEKSSVKRCLQDVFTEIYR